MLYFRLCFVKLRYEANAKVLCPQNRLGIHSIPLDNFSFSTYLIKRNTAMLIVLRKN